MRAIRNARPSQSSARITNRSRDLGAAPKDLARLTAPPAPRRRPAPPCAERPVVANRSSNPRTTAAAARPTGKDMSQDTPCPEASGADLPTARPAAYTQLRRAFERQLIRSNDFARVGDVGSALDARRAADAVCDELSAD